MEANVLHVQSIMDLQMELVPFVLHLNIQQEVKQHVSFAVVATALHVQVMDSHALHAHLALA